jgi:SAM-dependent methyltransferase
VNRWAADPLWGTVYDWTVEHESVGGVLWRVGIQSDLQVLYRAAAEVGDQPSGARILDVPCGGGVATRQLRPGQGVEYVAADISQRMVDRTLALAGELGVADQVTGQQADVEDLPFDDASFDLVVTFTGLHCFPDPARAVVEMCRVLEPGGVVTGSAWMTDTGLRYEPMRRAGRLGGLLGPGCSTDDVRLWLTAQGIDDVTLEVSGPMGYFRGVKA